MNQPASNTGQHGKSPGGVGNVPTTTGTAKNAPCGRCLSLLGRHWTSSRFRIGGQPHPRLPPRSTCAHDRRFLHKLSTCCCSIHPSKRSCRVDLTVLLFTSTMAGSAPTCKLVPSLCWSLCCRLGSVAVEYGWSNEKAAPVATSA